MSWGHSTPVAPKVLTAEELLKRETNWRSDYNDPERWIKDFKTDHYTLIGEYEVEGKLKLYRFELDEDYRKDKVEGTSLYHNVLIDRGLTSAKKRTEKK